jgi:PAS domain S-box-containing protein
MTSTRRDLSLAFLDGPGELAKMMCERDWSQTPLGPPTGWPSSLRTILQILLSSRYAMWMAWGPELTFFCNDAYRPTLGVKKDWLGARSDQVWEEIWDDVGPRIDHVLKSGQATWDEALMLILERSGFPEETYHTFSYSPLADDDGAINGMLCVVTEGTQGVIGERRLHVLRDLALRISHCRTHDDLWAGVKTCLAGDSRDLPLASAYVFEADGTARQTFVSGIAPGSDHVLPAWPLERIREGTGEFVVADVTGLRSKAWGHTSQQALLVPIVIQGRTTPVGVFVAGLNPYRVLDTDYRSFIELFVGQIAAGLNAVDAFEAERQRAEALAALDLAKTAFFSNVSHEFRTPLTLMLGPLEDALAESGNSPQQRERLGVAHRNSLRLLRLVNALLDFSRIEAGRAQAVFRPTDLAALTSELASSFRPATDKAGLVLKVDCPPLAEPVYVDRDMWEKIVLNLLSNAFKFTFAGTVEVTLARRDARSVRLTVRDTGTGIPAHELPRVFERFHRVEGARGRSFEGSGIGLSLVRELVRLHHGTIAVESTVDAGSTFRVDIPLGTEHLAADRVMDARDPVSDHARTAAFVDETLRWLPERRDEERLNDEALIAGTGASQAQGPRHRVLLADDNADLRSYIGRLLRERNYEVEAVGDGLDALEAIRARKPDVLVTDVMMPRLDGFGLLAAIRADATLIDLPVIMLSARAGEEARIEGLAAGADDYLIKPFSARELLARVGGTIGMATLRREANATIRATEARAAAVLEGMAEGFLLLDDDFRILVANVEAQRQSGGSADLVGRDYFDAWPGMAGSEAALHRARRDAVPTTFEEQRIAADGHAQWIEVRAYPSSEGLALFRRDISDRKRAETDLRELNDNLEQQVAQRTRERDRTWNTSQDLLIVLDPQGICIAVNPAWTSLLGHPASDVVGHSFLEFVHPDDHASSHLALDEAIVADLPRFENRYRHKDGSYRWFSWVASPEGGLVYASGRHITFEKEAAAELQFAQDQLRQSQKMEAVGQLTGGLAHDFNNLLTGISGSLELLQIRVARGQVGDLDRYVNAAQGAARRAAALTHRLLAFSRRQTLDPKPTDVNRLIADVEDLIRRTVSSAIEIEVIGAAGLWTAYVDQNQLENALLNLCINGRDAMPDGGRLTIETANRWLDDRAARERDLAPGHYLSVCVTDTGTGMTPEVQERAFDPFFTTKPLGAGTGLGLSMVYGFARQSGGQVRIYSEVGRGSTICIFLPRHTGESTADTAPGNARLPPVDLADRERVVLVVDDEATIRQLVTEVLQSLGCRTLEADDGATALRILQSNVHIDLLISDVGLPGGINGRQVADAARALREGLQILFITGYAENAVVGNGYLAHGMQVLTKPFAMDVLARRALEMLTET